ncbi:phage tail tape measure protein [Fibrella sp. WM1]|uniref:phage tail tape measure protein n=1 Tax=Fibrella musci TaxID=3242485 RepID=UPI0035230CBD
MQFKEEAVFTLKFDGKPVVNQLGELEKQLNDVKEAQKGVEKGTKEWADNKALIKELEASIKQVREEMGVSGMTVQQLKGYYKQLAAEIDKLTPGTEAYLKKADELQEVNTLLANHRATTRATNEEIEKQPSLWERAKGAAAGFLAAFSATELLEQAFNFVAGGIKKALELEDSMSGVAKATGQSSEEVRELSQELDKIDTRSTKESLMGIAQIGGQLGVANTELLGFVKSVDMANVALGDEFTGGAEEVSSALGGLQKLFKETKDLNAGEAINQIGSAINELGADGAATGPVIAEFTARMGQLGDLSPQIAQTMGLGAAFQELGLSAEISSGGLSNILLTAAKDTSTFAQQIGVADSQMKEWINTNPNEFLLRLAESLKNVPADQLATRLDALGIKSQEATKVMALLKDQTDMVRQKQELASKAMAEGTSLQKEFNTVNNNAAAEYEKSQKALSLIATEIGQSLLPGVTAVTRGVVTFVNVIRAVPEFLSENRTSFAALGVAILALNGNLVLATASSIAHAAAEKARQVWTGSATAAQWLLNAAMTANPIGLVVAAVALLVAGFTALYNNSSTLRGIISGTWEVVKTGAGLLADLTEKTIEFIGRGLDPLRPVLAAIGDGFVFVWNLVDRGVGWFNLLTGAAGTLVSGGLSRITVALEPVRQGLASFWTMIDQGVTKIKSIGSAISSFLHVDELVSKVKSAAGSIGDAFNKGYGDKLAEDRPKQVAAHQATLNTKKTAETKNANELADIVTASDQKALDKKAAQAEKHRQTELKQAQEAAKRQAEEVAKAEADAIRKTEEARINAIKDDLERDLARLKFKYDNEVAAIAQSKASQTTKAVWEKALTEQLHRDQDKIETDHRLKHEKEESEAAKRVLDLKIKLSGDEKADKLQKLEDVASAQRIQIEKDVKDETDKAALLKQINDRLIADKQRVEEEYRQKKAREDAALQDAQFRATVADADARLLLAGTNAQGIYEAKKLRLDAEYNYNKAKLEREAAEQVAHNNANIADTDRRAAANKATDDQLKANLTTNDVKYENDKTALTAEKTEARRKNQQEYYNAIKALMEGDFKEFTDILTKKLQGEKTQLTEKQKANISTIDAIGEYTLMAVNALNKLNQMKLEKELKNIQNERDSQLAAWKDKYNRGLISKDEYEKGVDKINKDADTKMKAAQVQAFRNQQKLDIALAIVNGAQAALKSLATLGWPLGLIGVAVSAATTAVQIGIIKAQQPPSMRRGGYVRNAGVVEGPSHGNRYGDSGLAITRRDTGEEVAEMEGGEPVMVLSRSTYRNNRRLIDGLMHSSLHRNGAPVMRDGGFFGEGGSYGDYVKHGPPRGRFQKGGVMFDGGGWMGEIEEEYDSGGYKEPVQDYKPSGSEETAESAAATIDSVTDEQIKQSQAAMELIGKNTGATALTLLDTNIALSKMTLQQTYDLGQVMEVLGLFRLDVREYLFQLNTEQAKRNDTLIRALEVLIGNLTKSLSTGLSGLGVDLKGQLVDLKQQTTQSLTELKHGLNTDIKQLEKSTTVAIDMLNTGTQTALSDLQASNEKEAERNRSVQQITMQQMSTDLTGGLTSLQTTTQQGFGQLTETSKQGMTSLQTTTQEALGQLNETSKQGLTSLQTTTQQGLGQLNETSKQGLTQLNETSKQGLDGVQGAVNNTNQTQNYQSQLLNRIADKDLSVSYQAFVNVQNQIDVVVQKSEFA